MERVVLPATSALTPSVLAAFGGIVALVILACTSGPLCFAVAWFFVALLPVANIVPLSTFMAEHWLYVPSMGSSSPPAGRSCVWPLCSGRASS